MYTEYAKQSVVYGIYVYKVKNTNIEDIEKTWSTWKNLVQRGRMGNIDKF